MNTRMEGYMNNKKMEPAFQKYVISKQGLVHFACDTVWKIIKNNGKF